MICGICKERVDDLLNFETRVGNPAVPIYEIIIKCTRAAKCKYIKGGVCNDCTNDLMTYHECVSVAKEKKQKLLDLIENKKEEKPNLVEPKDVFDDNFDEGAAESEDQEPYYATDDEDAVIVTSNECDECGQVFNDLYSCKIHKRKDHKKGFICEECGKKLYNKRSLKRHMFRHGGVKPFECNICQKRFFFQNRLNEHLTIHSGLKPFVCKICDKSFVNSNRLHSHTSLHKKSMAEHKKSTIAQKYCCPQCPKYFLTESRLQKHELKHSATRTHVCQYCDGRFNIKGDLTQHLKKNQKCKAAHEAENQMVQIEMEVDNLLAD